MGIMKNIYALLIGINNYKVVNGLAGCINDVEAFATTLEGLCKNKNLDGDNVKLNLKILTDEEATYDNIVTSFRDHLGQAGKGDVALFYFSGHGVQEKISKEFIDVFGKVEADGKNEALVCHDSYTPGVWALADKEINALLADIAKDSGPHITVILDCCHSGSGTRNTDLLGAKARLARPEFVTDRPLDSYCFYEKSHDIGMAIELPDAAPHVVISACEDRELAYELPFGRKQRGILSYNLIKTLEACNADISYAQLQNRVRAKVESTHNQHPQIQAFSGADKNSKFLGGGILSRPPYAATYIYIANNNAWFSNAGSAQGFRASELVAYPFEDMSDSSSQDLNKAVATLKIDKSEPHRCRLKILEGDLDTTKQYRLVVTKYDIPKVTVSFDGDDSAFTYFEHAVNTYDDNQPSQFIEVTKDKGDYRVLAQNETYFVLRPEEDRPLIKEIEGYSEESAKELVGKLEHIARWQQLKELENTETKLNQDDVQIVVRHNGEEHIGESVDLFAKDADDDGDFGQEIFVEVTLSETYTSRDLYCSLINFSPDFAIDVESFSLNGLRLSAKEKDNISVLKASEGDGIISYIPKVLYEDGVTERQDIYKLIVSTEPFDINTLSQEKLESFLSANAKRAVMRGDNDTLESVLESYITQVITRDTKKSKKSTDWFTKTLKVTIRAASPKQELSNTAKTALISENSTAVLSICPHPNLSATVSTQTLDQSTRSLDKLLPRAIVPAVLSDSQPFSLSTSRSLQTPHSVIAIENIQNPNVVTAEQPLVIDIEQSLADEEAVLAYAFDGEDFIPLGLSIKNENGTSSIAIEHIDQATVQSADNTDEQTRSIHGSLWMYLRKVVKQKLNLPHNGSRLTKVDIKNGTVVYSPKTENLHDLKELVEQANPQKILLYIHGITGDTRVMTKSAITELNIDGENKRIWDAYDLVLSFDYENLGTASEENAQKLKAKLEKIGVSSNRKIDIIAHSMGGLISRYFIEKEGGDAYVNKLAMLGTPNSGSPIATLSNVSSAVQNKISYKNWLTLMLGAGMNEVFEESKSIVSFVVNILGSNQSQESDSNNSLFTSMEQMLSDSDLIEKLNAVTYIKDNYCIICGDTSKIQEEGFKRMVKKLGLDATTALFFEEPNDIAVSVESAFSAPTTNQHRVACTHIGYFINDTSLQLTYKFLK